MRLTDKRMTAALTLLAVGISAAIAYRSSSYWQGDYPREAARSIDALLDGRLSDFLSAQGPIGIFGLLFRAPFAALSRITGGGGPIDMYDTAYRFGVFPCMVAGGALAVILARRYGRRGGSQIVQVAIVVAMLLNPANKTAIFDGHPEEMLATALGIGAVLAALAQRPKLSVGMLALAFLTKEWAIVLVVPIAVQLGWQRIRKPLIGGAVLVALALGAMAITDPRSFYTTKLGLLNIGDQPLNPSIWWFVTDPKPHGLPIQHQMPELLSKWSHLLIILMSVVIPLLLARRVRLAPAARLLPLVAAVLLLRALMDPIDNRYYHLPFYAALLAMGAERGSFVPAVVAFAAMEATSLLQFNPDLLSAFYIVWTLGFVVYLLGEAGGFFEHRPERIRQRRGLLTPVVEAD